MDTAWAEEITARARLHWTEPRLQALTRGKTLALSPVEAAPLLRALGILNGDGSMPPARARKFLQINHMVAVLGPSLRELMARFELVRIVDAACGRSYLTLLLAWVLRHRHAHGVEVLGVDRNPDVIDECRRRAAMTELGDVVRFEVAALGELDAAGVPALFATAFERAHDPSLRVHALVALHACDTATDDALALGVALRAELLAAAPCCQAELAREWSSLADAEGPFAPLRRAPHLRREAAATMTDALRGLLLAASGYETWTLEFVPSEHTPKNTLLRAMRRRDAVDVAAAREYVALRDAIGSRGIALEAKSPADVRDAIAVAPPGPSR
jgi:SAM-dependent methyltransferase